MTFGKFQLTPDMAETLRNAEPGKLYELPAAMGSPILYRHDPQAGRLHVMASPGYDALAGVLRRAFEQASSGKGKERHAQGKPFEAQPMQGICDLVGPAFALGQAIKKAQESLRLPPDRAVAELLGAINYIAGAVIAMERSANG